MLESAVESRLIQNVKSAGGMCIKLVPTIAGLPDRLVLLPDGRHHFIELKTERGKIRKIQKVWFKRMERIGHPVTVLHGSAEVDDWCESNLFS